MKGFADTSYFEALLSRRDEHHELAIEVSRLPWRHIITSEFILLELGATFSKPADRADFLLIENMVRTRDDMIVIPVSSDLFMRAKALFASHPDKAWSLTDYTSFIIMQEHGLTEALTTDHHFTQAGFHALLGS
jgi:uncharacterized protein